jgi:hypothetical protein
MEITRRRLLMVLPAAAMAWKFVLAGTPEASPNSCSPHLFSCWLRPSRCNCTWDIPSARWKCI